MKKKFLLFTFLLLGFTVSAQEKQRTLGILVSPNLECNSPDYGSNQKRRLSHTFGIFYDHQLMRRFGINTGLLLDTERYKYDYSDSWSRYDMNWPKTAKARTNAIEVPLNLTFCFNPDNENGYRAFLYSGITLHRQFFFKYTGYYHNEVKIYKSDGYNSNLWADSYLNLGIEFRKNVGTHYLFGMGGSAKFSPAHIFEHSSESRYPVILNLNLKFGRNL